MDPYEETHESWNKVAKLYNDNFMDLTYYDHTYDSFIQQIPHQGQVLEIGCGPGNITRYIHSKRPDLRIEATDNSPQMIEWARRNNPGVDCKVMDCRNLNTVNTLYDAIICGFCIPYLNEDDCTRLFNDVKKLLRPGGIFYLSFVAGDYALSGYKTGSSGDRMYFYYHHEVFIHGLLETNGFHTTQHFDVQYPLKDVTIEIHTILITQG
jgi:SAM-dependent methyltransferase